MLWRRPHKHAILRSQPHRQVPKNLLQLVGLGAGENDNDIAGVLHTLYRGNAGDWASRWADVLLVLHKHML